MDGWMSELLTHTGHIINRHSHNYLKKKKKMFNNVWQQAPDKSTIFSGLRTVLKTSPKYF